MTTTHSPPSTATPTTSSRLIVKGLPARFDDERQLRRLFERFGTLTDVSLKRNAAGVLRRFAFVGFTTEESAAKAARALNNTFVRTSRITVY